MKSTESIAEKMNRKGVSDPSKLEDISGTRILTKDANETLQTIERFKAAYRSSINPKTEDNYYANPKDTGYRAYHATIIINNEPHEVQIRTENMNHWAENQHEIYKNEPFVRGLRDDPEVREYYKKAAEAFQSRDEGRYKSLPTRIPQSMRDLGIHL